MPVLRRLLAISVPLACAAVGPLAAPGVARARPGDAAAVVAGGIAKGPYLQALGATGVTVKVELAVPGPALVEVFAAGGHDGGHDGGPEGGPAVARAEATEPRALHALRVDGLLPATAYAYRVTAGGVVAERGSFTTAPVDARPFRFLAYGDSRTDPQAHAAVVRAMEAAAGDFLVNTGDMVAMGNEPRDWAELFAIEGKLLRDRCVFVAVGNHELARGDAAGQVAFLHYFAGAEKGHDLDRLWSTFRWSNTRFFVLNAMDTWTADERGWLRAELDRALHEPGLAHRIAVMHWGPFSSGPHGGNPALDKGGVLAMMRERKVDLVIAGHDHDYERGAGGGLKYVVTGGAGAPLYPRKSDRPETLRYEAAYHHLEVAVDGDHVTVTARRPTGAVLETCGFQGAGAWDCEPESPAARAADVARARGACGGFLPGLTGPRAAVLVAVVLLVLLAALARRRSWW